MKSIAMSKITVVSQLAVSVKRTLDNGFLIPDEYSDKGISSRFHNETKNYLNKRIPKENREREKFVFEKSLDPNSEMLERRVEYHYVTDGDFFQEQKNKFLIQQIERVLVVISCVLNDLGGEVHKAIFYSEEDGELGKQEFSYKLNSKEEVDLARYYIDKVFSKAKIDEIFHIKNAEFELELNVHRNSNITFVAEEVLTMVGLVCGVMEHANFVFLKASDTGGVNKYTYTAEQRDCLIKFQDWRTEKLFKYRPSLKSQLGKEVECGGSIEGIYDIEEEGLL